MSIDVTITITGDTSDSRKTFSFPSFESFDANMLEEFVDNYKKLFVENDEQF